MEKIRKGKPFEAEVKGIALNIRDQMVIRDTQSGTRIVFFLVANWDSRHSQPRFSTFSPNVEGQVPSQNQTKLYKFATCTDEFMSIKTSVLEEGNGRRVRNGCLWFIHVYSIPSVLK